VILADTSVWIEHFRRGHAGLVRALEEREVLVHPFVIGELSCGNFARRPVVMDLLHALPSTRVATHAEVLAMIDRRKLMGRGIGYIDAHLLAATALTFGASLMTQDRRLSRLARELDLAL
jgi:predicted nucleic acid-binding protein